MINSILPYRVDILALSHCLLARGDHCVGDWINSLLFYERAVKNKHMKIQYNGILVPNT